MESADTRRGRTLLALAGCLGIALLAALCMLGAGLLAVSQRPGPATALPPAAAALPDEAAAAVSASPLPAPSPTPPPPTPMASTAAATASPVDTATPTVPATLPAPPPGTLQQAPAPPQLYTDLDRLLQAEIPPHDFFETARRLGGRDLGGRTISGPYYRLGDTRTFHTDDGQVTARLVTATDHAYFWVASGLDLDAAALRAAAERLETAYYPQLVAQFGREWQPGVDNDPHFSILHLQLPVDSPELGHFSSVDEYPQALYAESNEQELVYLNMSAMGVGDPLYDGTLVHELQHLIQWHVDPNEATWLNEGLSQLAEHMVGLDTVATEPYLAQPDIQLNRWAYDDHVIDAHYAGAYLYLVYLWEQLGDRAIQELARHPANGLAAVDDILAGFDGRDLATFTGDWAAANYLDDGRAGQAFAYRQLQVEPPVAQKRIRRLPEDRLGLINQFGVHYYEIMVPGPVTINFTGDTQVDLLPPPPPPGRLWLAPGANESNATLTALLDLSGLSAATLRFDAWYDLEPEWDFAYLLVSADGGQSWDVQPLQHPSVGEFGPAFNGRSDAANSDGTGWVPESVSLHSYLGQSVQVRFQVLTDGSVAGAGFAVANLMLDEETEGTHPLTGWTSAGFVPLGNRLPQLWQLRLIQPGTPPTVTAIPLDASQQASWSGELGPQGGVLAITAATPFTANPARYWLRLD